MPFYKSFLNTLVLPIANTLTGGYYLKYLKEWKELDVLSENELELLQSKRLNNMLAYAKKHVPYYKNIDASKISDFPILTKNILRDQTSNLVSDDYNIDDLDKHHSSGSSGIQSFTYMTKEHTFYLRALQTHWWTWSDYRVGDNLLQFGISQKRSLLKKLKDIFYKCTYVKAFGLSETELEAVLIKISKKKRVFIAGYPSVINQLAKTAIKQKIKSDVVGIICFGDKLFDNYHNNMVEAFGSNCKIIDTYGCAEGLLMACKRDLDSYYVMSPHVYLEIVDDNGYPVEDGTMGHVLVTCLTNKAMPLIRYKLGDLAIKLPKTDYPEDGLLNYPLLKKVIGRETDIVKTTMGITLNVHSFTGVLEYFQEIKQYKIIQNDLESIIIEYIVDANYKFDQGVLNSIENKLNTLTKNCLMIHFKEVTEIRPTKSGKPQIIESNLKSF